jgi:DNA-binding transcriptional MerR regulator
VYPAEAIQRVRLIRGALSLGFTIAEMKQLLRQRDTGGAPCLLARRIAQTKLDLLEQELEEMQEYRKILRKALRAWDSRIACSPANARLRLLETFIEAYPESTKRSSPLLPRGLRKLQARKSR